jgi:ABC-type nitrate/sulfonate/bicarbonate transport system permease component
VLFVAVWAVATLGGFVPKLFLASPITMVEEGWALMTKHGFAYRHRHHHLARGGRLRAGCGASPCRSAS